jgi:RNA polymerase sigma factor (sigma-70 family)
MEEKGKYRIRLDGRVIEVTREIYSDYYRMSRRERYLEERDLVHGKTLYSDLDTEDTTGEDMLPDRDAASVEDTVIKRVMAARLRTCLSLLTESELALIVMRYYEDRSQNEIAAELGISQSNICRKEARILLKLRNMLEK